MSVARAATVIAAITVALPTAALAQPLGKIVVTPYVGVFAPNNELAKSSQTDGAVASRIEQRNALALGATGAYWFAPRASMEVGALYAWSDVRSKFVLNQPGTSETFYEARNAGVFLGAAKLMLGLFPASSDFQLRLGFGPALIAHVGSAYNGGADGTITGRTNIGGAVSLCTKVPIASRMALRLRVEDYMYQSRLRWKDMSNPADNFKFDKRFQHDFVLSTGLQIGLIR
ncbi:MAG TPA: hypothetical protein VH762_15645 [Gemmatimonadaceae bacterium]|jgi:hypothetical protein